MRDEEFEGWLKWRGVTSENAIGTRTHAVRKIQSSLGELGQPCRDLEEAFADDRFAALRQRLAAMREDAEAGGQDYRILMPDSEQPLNRLRSWRSWLGQYGQFLSDATSLDPDDQFDRGMDQLRQTFLMRMNDFEDMRVENGDFWDTEKSYKYEARGDVIMAVAELEHTEEQRGKVVYERLCQGTTQGLPLGWRTRADVLKATPDLQARFYRVIAGLTDREAPIGVVAENAARSLEELRDEGMDCFRRGEVLNIILSVLGTVRPKESCWFKSNLFDNASKLLLGKRLFPHDRFEREDFEEFQSFLIRIQSRLEDWGWHPETFEDVQGFLWIVLAREWKDEVVIVEGLTCQAVESAMDEYDAIGPQGFRNQYGYGKPKQYWVIRPANSQPYPAKAIAGVAHGHVEGGRALKVDEFYGGQGEQQANRLLRKLGYEVVIRDGGVEDGGSIGKAIAAPTNLILYGPPGTGKTWHTAREAVALCDGKADYPETPAGRRALMARYNVLVEERRIAFVTFHQNFSYEDFVEGLRPVPLDVDGEAAGFLLQAEPGIFRQIVERAQTAGLKAGEQGFDLTDRAVYKMSLGEAGKPAYDFVFTDSIANGYALLGFRDIDWSDPRFEDRDEIFAEVKQRYPDEDIGPNKGLVRLPDVFRNQLQVGDVLIVSKGNSTFRAIGIVEGEYEFAPRADGKYCHRRRVQWVWSDPAGRNVSEIYSSKFQMNTIYRLKDAELDRPAMARLVAGMKHGGAPAEADPLPHVLIIDEINRANISKVFGELITLIEPDKRLGMPNALTLTLPYSKKRDFGVPANLHIVGTMNTADRSIALLDTALRRRFAFREIAPEPGLLGTVGGIDLAGLLATINDRIEYLIDREHRIGHAFFISCETRQHVDVAMRDKVIPLLQEYFFEDWSRVAAVLGDGFIGHRLLTCPMGEGEDRPSWFIRGENQADGSHAFPENAYDRLLGRAGQAQSE